MNTCRFTNLQLEKRQKTTVKTIFTVFNITYFIDERFFYDREDHNGNNFRSNDNESFPILRTLHTYLLKFSLRQFHYLLFL